MSDDIDPIHAIVQSHLIDSMRGYQGNLAAVAMAVANGWLPEESTADIQLHIATLRDHLASNGCPTDDSFLLRFGLTVPGTHRGIVPPVMVLEERRGGFSVRRRREAAGQIERLREALLVGRRLFPALSHDTQQAISELSDQLTIATIKRNTDTPDGVSMLTATKAEALAQKAIELLDEGKPVCEIGETILQQLACYRSGGLSTSILHELLDRSLLYPSCIYRDADDEIALRLISLVDDDQEQPDPLRLNQVLCCLAWTRGEAAADAFRQWAANCPKWVSILNVPPKVYSQVAGWQLTESGQRQELIASSCYRLALCDRAEQGDIHCFQRQGEACDVCGGELICLFDFREIDGHVVFHQFPEAPRKVVCCVNCAMMSPPAFSKYGTPVEERRQRRKLLRHDLDNTFQSCHRRLAEPPISTFANAVTFGLPDASTLGGIPMWIQDVGFPRCVGCGRLMTFFAQHDNSLQGREGVFYAFFCAACRVSAVNYQQT